MGSYFTIGSAVEAVLKVEGSRFVAEAFPIFAEAEADAQLDAVRKKYFDATHHCFAFAIGEDRSVFRYSDDGEPSGTAGIKIFSALQSRGLSDILLVVTRYFGGTKLGVGGLGRAYHDAALGVLERTTSVLRVPVQEITAVVEYSHITPVMSLAHKAEAFIDRSEYGEKVTFSILVPHAAVPEFERQLVDITNGAAVLTRGIRTIRSA
jgi:uncharacterized YigZ family protein